jgi:hypothetical protein
MSIETRTRERASVGASWSRMVPGGVMVAARVAGGGQRRAMTLALTDRRGVTK